MAVDGERQERRPGISRRDWLAILAGVGLLFVVRELMRQPVPEVPAPAGGRREQAFRAAATPQRELSPAERAERREQLRQGQRAFDEAPDDARALAVDIAYPLAIATLIDLGRVHGELLDEPPAPSGSAAGGFARQRHSFGVDGRWYRFEAFDVPEYGPWERRRAAEESGATDAGGAAEVRLSPATAGAVARRLDEALRALGDD